MRGEKRITQMSMIGVILKVNITRTTLFSVMEGRRWNKEIFRQNNNIFKIYTVFVYCKTHYWEKFE